MGRAIVDHSAIFDNLPHPSTHLYVMRLLYYYLDVRVGGGGGGGEEEGEKGEGGDCQIWRNDRQSLLRQEITPPWVHCVIVIGFLLVGAWSVNSDKNYFYLISKFVLSRLFAHLFLIGISGKTGTTSNWEHQTYFVPATPSSISPQVAPACRTDRQEATAVLIRWPAVHAASAAGHHVQQPPGGDREGARYPPSPAEDQVRLPAAGAAASRPGPSGRTGATTAWG